MDRYNHDLGEDTDDTDDSPLFGSFSSYSPQSRKISQTRPPSFISESDSDFLKKQLFRNELEKTMAQLSLNSPISNSSPAKSEEKVVHQTVEKSQVHTSVVKQLIMSDEPNKSEEKTDSSSNSPSIVENAEPQQSNKTTPPSSNFACQSTPDSSQTESEDISPQIQKKRHSHVRDKLPRFSISIDAENL